MFVLVWSAYFVACRQNYKAGVWKSHQHLYVSSAVLVNVVRRAIARSLDATDKVIVFRQLEMLNCVS